MAVNIDTVYQRVLSIANKEQRGYITPLEFNLLANQVQMDIFEQYFYDINQFGRLPGNDTQYSDMLNILEEKISIFERVDQPFGVVGGAGTLPNHYRMGALFWNVGGDQNEIELVNNKEVRLFNQTPLAMPSEARPVYVKTAERIIQIFPDTITGDITCNFIAAPAKVIWGYDVINGKALYNAGTSIDFELHESEETSLVMKVLELAGIIMNKPGVVQIAGQEDLQKTQQEKA